LPEKKISKANIKPRCLIKVTDDLGTTLIFPRSPQKIVSLVPSLTETLVAAGLKSSLAGITKFCVHPKELLKGIEVIGGTKNPRINAIIRLKPDLIFANKEENRLEDITELKQHTQVYVTDISSHQDVVSFIHTLYLIFNTSECKHLMNQIKNLPDYTKRKKISTCYLIWKNPWMTVGKDTFIHHMMEKYGFKNVYETEVRYPEITLESIQVLKPKIIMLSSEPYPFKEKDKAALHKLLPETSIILVDGEMFSWYGSRLLEADEYINDVYHNHLSQ
jgi:ABC-type Fe3+-hydroxamate transport system substrate-binding protein